MRPINTILIDSPRLRVGSFRLPRGHPDFTHAGAIVRPVIVFPRNSVAITFAGRPTILSNPNIALFYNHRQEYRRQCVDEEGDRCDFFSFEPRTIADACESLESDAGEDPERPFPFTHVPIDAQTYLRQRLVVEHLRQPRRDDLLVEESLFEVLAAVLSAASRFRKAAVGVPPPTAAHRDLVRAAQWILAASFRENLTLAEIARIAGCSPFHLARLFRRVTGSSLHAYRNGARLRHALEQVAEGGTDLAQVALDLGYATHSHFTMAFRRAYGMTPAAFRRRASSKAVDRARRQI